MSTNRNRISIIAQVTMLIAICTLATGILTLFTQRARSELTVKAQTEELLQIAAITPRTNIFTLFICIQCENPLNLRNF